MHITRSAGLAAALTVALATPALALDVAQTSVLGDKNAAAVWQTIGDFCGIGTWHPAVAKCELGAKDGAKIRTLTLQGNGGTVVEKLVNWDDNAHSYTYAILEPGPLPVANYTSTITVMDMGAGSAISWTGHFDAAGAPDADSAKAIEGVYRGGLDGIVAKANGG